MLKPKAPYVIAHWSTLAEDFTTSSDAFYASVQAAVEARQLSDVSFSRVLWKEGGITSAQREYLRVQRGRLAFDICAAPHGTGYFFSSWLARVPFGNAPLVLLVFAVLVGAGVFALLVISGMMAQAVDGIPCGLYALLFMGVCVAIPIGIFLLGNAIHQGHFLDEELVLSIPWVGYLYAMLFNPLAYYRLDTALMFQKSVHNTVMEAIDGLHSVQGMRALSGEERQATVRDFAR